ncbi:MAG: phenylphosphate carboxylase subunit gamma, partial [Chloroflexota bacterium]|nr:phenylphosphate carboxylase subunit gamma [Chloroflexota bacterium]
MTGKQTEGRPVLAEAYETFVRDISDLAEGQPTPLVLRDLTPGRRKYFAQNALAVVTREADASGRSRPLKVRSRVGNELPGRWQVTVLEILPS